MAKQNLMKISELSSASETPISTIKYYASEKILPPVIKTGKTISYYTDEHLKRLKLIKKMKANRLSIKMIKEILFDQHPDDPENYDIDKVHHAKRESILKAAIMVFRKKGYNDTTIADIVNEAKVGRNTFYAHFKNKETLFFECADNIFDNLDSAINELKEEPNLEKRLKMRVRHVFENPHLMDMINLIKGSSVNRPTFKRKLVEIIRIYIKPIQKELEEGHQQGIFRKVDNLLLGYLLMGLVEYGFHFYHNETYASFDSLFEALKDFIQNGLKAE